MYEGIHVVPMGVSTSALMILECTRTLGILFWASGPVHIPSLGPVVSLVLLYLTHSRMHSLPDLALTLSQGPVIIRAFIHLHTRIHALKEESQ